MQILSPAFEDNTMLPKVYTCDGQGVNPPLEFSTVPSDAKSLALTVEDPDAPHGTFTHWIVYNMPPNTAEIAENSVPENCVEGITSLKKTGFVAVCPPNGSHHYIFTLFALDIMLPTDTLFDSASLTYAMQGHIVGKARLTGLYQRSTT